LKRILIGVCGAVLALLTACALLLWLLQPPDDASMIANLREHHATFEELVHMVRADQGLARVDDTWTDPSDPSTVGVTAERIATYRRLFDQAGVPRGFYAYGGANTIEFVARTAGISVSGWSKSYVYAEQALGIVGDGTLVDDPLDNYHRQAKVVVMRQIEPNWYLQFSSN
jgi:hypothetical protein